MKYVTVRQLSKALSDIGCEPVRCRGSHQTWRTPGGLRLGLVISHPGDNVSRRVLSCVRRILRQEGVERDLLARLRRN